MSNTRNVLCIEIQNTGDRHLFTPLFADIPADMTEEEKELSEFTPSMPPPPPDLPGVAPEAVDFVKTQIADNEVVVWSLEYSEFCWTLTSFLDRLQVPYTKIGTDSFEYAKDQMWNWRLKDDLLYLGNRLIATALATANQGTNRIQCASHIVRSRACFDKEILDKIHLAISDRTGKDGMKNVSNRQLLHFRKDRFLLLQHGTFALATVSEMYLSKEWSERPSIVAGIKVSQMPLWRTEWRSVPPAS